MRFQIPHACLLLACACCGSAAAGESSAAPTRFRVSTEAIEPRIGPQSSDVAGVGREVPAPRYRLQVLSIDTPATARFRLLGVAAPKSAGNCAQDVLLADGFEG